MERQRRSDLGYEQSQLFCVDFRLTHTPDVHVKLGGTSGSEQTANECAPGSDAERCRVAALMFHITPKASGYFESMILEVAETDYTGVSSSLHDCPLFSALSQILMLS
jgi:hypothetical protein